MHFKTINEGGGKDGLKSGIFFFPTSFHSPVKDTRLPKLKLVLSFNKLYRDLTKGWEGG